MMMTRCLMLRSRTPTSSHLAGQDVGTPSTTSCRVLVTLRAESSPLRSLYPSCTSTQEGEMQTTPMTPKVHRPRPKEKRRRRTANVTRSIAGELNIARLSPAGPLPGPNSLFTPGRSSGGEHNTDAFA